MKEVWRSFVVLIVLTLITGLLYPLLITGIGQIAFQHQANGSLVEESGTILGSSLIGQNFTSPKYFWGRPSATSPAYNAASSTASNLGPLNPQLLTNVKGYIAKLQAADLSQTALIPIDLVTSSGSGLDPDISVAAAEYQAPRIAKVRGLPVKTVDDLIIANITLPQLGFLGQPRVNVLKLNLVLDQVK